MIDFMINGQPHRLENAINISELLQQLNLSGKRLALERNGEIVRRSDFERTEVASGDKLEIVIAVGGG